LTKESRWGWGAFGGLLPFVIRFISVALSDVTRDISPDMGTFYFAGVIVCAILGAIASHIFESNSPLAAIYSGATAPLTMAFLSGIDPHTFNIPQS
jgi:hypothetical protein